MMKITKLLFSRVLPITIISTFLFLAGCGQQGEESADHDHAEGHEHAEHDH